jgi:gliding motility-associated-like protein
LSPVFAGTTYGYTANVVSGVSSLNITPTTSDPNATLTVNGNSTTSGTAVPITLAFGPNVITTTVTAQNDTATRTYTVTVTRQLSANANLASLGLSAGTKSPAFLPSQGTYTASVVNGVATVTVTPVTADPNAKVTVNNTAVASGTGTQVALSVGPNVITTVVTAQDGVTKMIYTLTITRAPSSNDKLVSLKVSRGTLSPTFAQTTTGYTVSVVNGVSSVTITPTAADRNATLLLNGTTPVASGATSGPIALAVGPNTITVQVTAQDNVTNETYTLTVTRAAGSVDNYDPGISVTKPGETPTLADDGLLVHQAISPNGDGINDFLQIDNISQYPDNKLSIMNRNGQLVYQANGYDNTTKVFDGHSNRNGQMQLPGTYFYQLDYTVSGIIKHKTGFIVLKY